MSTTVTVPAGSRVRVAASASIDAHTPYAASANGVDLVVLRTARGLHAYQGHCPHQGALLAEGEIEEHTLVGRSHRWRIAPG